jgi:hypothetical protein
MQTQYYCYGCSINTTDFPVVNVYVTDYSKEKRKDFTKEKKRKKKKKNIKKQTNK